MLVVDGVEMIDVREAARIAHRTPETIRRWVWSGRLDAVKVGVKLVMRREEILRLSAEAAPAATTSMSLGDWARQAARANHSGRRGVSARDMVFDDRSQRDREGRRARR